MHTLHNSAGFGLLPAVPMSATAHASWSGHGLWQLGLIHIKAPSQQRAQRRHAEWKSSIADQL